MRVLIYTRSFAPNIGGVETIVMSLASGLASSSGGRNAKKIEITLITSQSIEQYDESLLPFRVVRHPSWWEMVRLLRSAEIVHLAGPTFLPLLLALIICKPVIVEHHGFQAICPNGQLIYEPDQQPCPGHFMACRHYECWRCNSKLGWLASFKLWLLTFPRRWLCRFAAANITPTDWLGGLLHLRRTETIFHGIALTSANCAVPTTPPIFVFQGRLVSAKGVHVLLHAASRLKAMGSDFILKIIGDGPARASLESMVTELNLSDRVHFFGILPPVDLERALAGATAVVMPSLGGEVFGLVAAENMARGHLLVVSDLGALVEVVSGAGLSFRTGDPEHLAAQLAAVLRSPTMVGNKRQRAIQRCRDYFDQQAMIENHISLYRKVLGGKGNIC